MEPFTTGIKLNISAVITLYVFIMFCQSSFAVPKDVTLNFTYTLQILNKEKLQ